IAGGRVIALDVNPARLAFCQKTLQVDHALQALAPDLTEQISRITDGDMPTVIIDATGNQNAINNAFRLMAHTARYILIGLQKDEIRLSHPEFHKREGTLMSSRNATRTDFDYVIDCIEKKRIRPETYITHRLHFNTVREQFSRLFGSGEVI